MDIVEAGADEARVCQVREEQQRHFKVGAIEVGVTETGVVDERQSGGGR